MPGGRSRPLALAGIPCNSSGRRDGVALAPVALRAAGLAGALRLLDPTLVDLGDAELPPPSPFRDPGSHLIDPPGLLATMDAARDAAGAALAAGRFPILVGGDCPILLGALEAASAASPSGACGCLFVDGHEDAYPPEASPSGEAADMELGFALGRGTERLPGALRARFPLLEPREVVVLGARDSVEIRAYGVTSLRGVVPVIDGATLRAGPARIADLEARRVAAVTGAWWLHVDLDVLSTVALAAVDYPQAGGLTWADLRALVEAALQVPGCAGMTVTIYNPDLDPLRSGARDVVAFLADVLGGAGAPDAISR